VISIYIMEAHAADEWPLGRKVEIKQHKTLEDRMAAHDYWNANYPWKIPMVIDPISNDFNKVYAAWPERYFTIADGKMLFIDEPNEFGEVSIDWTAKVRHFVDQYYAAKAPPAC